MFFNLRHLHFVGVGGIGMSGIAEVLLNQGFRITGSDLQDSQIIARLRYLGGEIAIGHDAQNLQGAEVVVYSSAVKPDNPELQEAQRLGLPTIPRAEVLGELMRMKFGIAIAGTHGKTTTTSMVAAILTEAELDPTFIVGGRVKSLSTNARLGSGEFLIAEADEFDRSFLRLTPVLAVLTTLETEHLDTYRDLNDIQNAFLQFANRVPFYGSVILCVDEPTLAGLIPRLERPVITYGLHPEANFRAGDMAFQEVRSSFNVFHGETNLGKIQLNQPGLHNVKNALAAVCVASELRIPFAVVQCGLANFHGVERRFEIKGEAAGVLVVDDYAHHPTEIRATLSAAKAGFSRRVVAVFQPHLYSRTRDFADDFGVSFGDADVLIVMGIYAARETPLPGVSGELIAAAANQHGHLDVRYLPEKEQVIPELLKLLQSGDMVVTLGAGDVYQIAQGLLTALQCQDSARV